jgi:hypothetical protein
MSASAPNTPPSSHIPEGAIPAAGNTGGWIKPWQKGQSGNPTGVSGEYFRVRKICADRSMDATRTLLQLMDDQDADQRVRYMAAMAIIERGIGKPRDHSADGESVMDLTKLSEGERRTLLELMSRVLGVDMPK